MPAKLFQAVSVVLTLAAGTAAYGATHTVSTLADLQSRLDQAAPGDTIVVKSGNYSTTAPVVVRKGGSAEKRLAIAAETIGGVELTGSDGFVVEGTASHVTIEGFVFTHKGSMRLNVGANHVRVTRNVFAMKQAGETSHYLVIDGDDTEVDRNEFRDKSWVGQMLKIGGAANIRPAERTWVHHNYFHDFTNVGRNGGETIQVAVGKNSLLHAHSVIEHNLFVRCNGENELISNKSGSNVYRANTFRDSPGGELTLRDGDNVTIAGNFFFNTAGIRIFGDNHKVYNNYFEDCRIAINVGSAGSVDHVRDDPNFKGYDQVSNLRLTHNTLVNNMRSLCFQSRKDGLGATTSVFANNLIVGDSRKLVEPGTELTDAKWEGNILWGTAEDGAIPAEGFQRIDPKLVKADVFRLERGSPAIDAGKSSFTEVVVDMDGQPRTGKPDVGADELSIAPIESKPLTEKDVGPNSADSGGRP